MKTRFDNSDYVRSHGKNPKGFGGWVFSVVGSDGAGSYTSLLDLHVTGTLTDAKREAKRQAIAEARSIGRVKELTIFVQP